MENKEIGNRIRSFRSIYNRGSSISSAQLAHRLELGPDKLRNYESGRSSLPLGILLKLHNQGLDMHYLLTGEGTLFSDTPEGQRLLAEMDELGVEYPGKITRAAAGKISR